MKLRLAVVAAITLLTACSPYVYKTEIGAFASGVGDLTSAYSDGLKELAAARGERERWELTRASAPLALTSGCVPGGAGASMAQTPCVVHEVNKLPAVPSKTELQAASARSAAAALKKYADALAAVTNAEDAQTLAAAQADFNAAIVGLASDDKSATAELGAVADLFSAVTTAVLNQRRYDALKRGVNAAQEPVATLGNALGEALDSMRVARASELRDTANLMIIGMGGEVKDDEYMKRLVTVQERAAALEALRQSDPKQAASDMIKAHAALAAALSDDARQISAVLAAIRDFVDKAKAVREAFGAS